MSMAQVVGFVGQSHSPLWSVAPPHATADPGAIFVAAVERSRALVASTAPDVLVLFGPDHFRFAFYDMMPKFCIGAGRLAGFGDYGTPAGDLPVNTSLARHIHDWVCANGFDPALSLDMGIDHGLSQTYSSLFPDLNIPIVPIVVNTSGPPLAPPRRAYEFGRAVGVAISAYPGQERVIVAGSGGLSHWPPSTNPFDPALDGDQREYLITGRTRVTEVEAGRQARVRGIGQAGGRVNPQWDGQVLEALQAGQLDELLEWDEATIDRDGGNGGQEIRAWLAALGAFYGSGAQEGRSDVGYEPVASWITGMGTLTVLADTPHMDVPAPG